MIGISTNNDLQLLMNCPTRKICTDHLNSICKIRQGEKACRYIVLGPQGFVCMKCTNMKKAIDQMCSDNKMTAQGDNCGGLGDNNASSEKVQEESTQTQDKEKNSLSTS